MEIALGSVDLVSTCSSFLYHREYPLAIIAVFIMGKLLEKEKINYNFTKYSWNF